jgi:phosphohistidine swiveling domain-containing protein
MAPVLALDDARCRDVGVAGAKAAALSQARALGLPALPGYVVTTAAAACAIAVGRHALTRRGSGGARLAVQADPVPDGLRRQLVELVADLAGPVIVRSSATVEGAGEWAGAFSSFADVDADTVVTATKGTWAALFGVEVLERAEHAGVDIADVGMATLIQPMVSPEVAGHARLVGEQVHVTAVEGSPAGLMSGWVTGLSATVSAGGQVQGAALGLMSDVEALAVAGVARRCAELLGHDTVEWALVGGEVVLLQSTRVGRPDVAPAAPAVARLEELDSPVADRVAALVLDFPGGLSEELVLPWAVGLPDPRTLHGTGLRREAAADLEVLRARSRELSGQVWQAVPGDAPWREVLRDLRSDRPGDALALLSRVGQPALEEARDLLTAILATGSAAAGSGILRRAEEIFGCEQADLDPVRALQPRQSWAGARRWEPFLAAVAQTRGESVTGTPATPGVGAGAARVVHDSEAARHATYARSVIVATHPVPGLAPLLWNAAALVTTQGSVGAHLLEVAHSLGVPAVVHCADLPLAALTASTVVAVDGDTGRVSWHRPL